MPTYGSNLQDALMSQLDSLNDRLQQAMDNTMARSQPMIDEYVLEYAIENFYEGYTPTVYHRTGQLAERQVIESELKDISNSDALMFQIVTHFYPDRMNHGEYKVEAEYYREKRRGKGKKRYRRKKNSKSQYIIRPKKNVNEERILTETLQFGLHGFMGSQDTIAPIIIDDGGTPDGCLIQAFSDFIKHDFDRIFNEELNKLK